METKSLKVEKSIHARVKKHCKRKKILVEGFVTQAIEEKLTRELSEVKKPC